MKLEDVTSNTPDARIVVEDNGSGMDLKTILKVWLQPGTDHRKHQKESGWRTPRFNRRPLGEKGVGRFAVHKLGKVCVAQGNLYLKDGWEATGTPFPMMVDPEAIKLELYKLFAFRPHREDPEKNKKTQQWKERMGVIAKLAIPCAVEISPGCDRAQKKMVYARVLGGLLIPDDGQPLFLPADVRQYAKQLPLFQIKDEARKIEGRYSLVLNARHLVTPTPVALKMVQRLLRIRESVAIDIQAWFSGHAGRAGFVSLW